MITRRALVLGIAVGLAACGGDDDANEPPVAVEDLVTVDEDAPIAIEVLANDSDPEGQPLRLLGASARGHDVTVDGAFVRVMPDANWNGTIEVNYVISDGKESGYGRAVVTVAPVNDAPVAKTTAVATSRNTAKLVKLEGSDVDGDALTFEVESGPAHGTISGTTPELTYTPAANYVGGDTIVFRVSDSALSSAAGTVSITVVAGTAPVGQAQMVSVVEDTSKAVMLAATDADNDPVTFAIVQQPAHGTLAGTPPALTYTPAENYHGTDSFKFEADDGVLTSSPTTVAVNVTPANDAPVASVQTVAATEDVAVAITLAGTDVDGDALTYAIVQAPTRGTLAGTGATRTYQPAANLNGADSFTFTVSDGQATSAPATVTIGVAPAADAPVATAQSVTVAEDGARSIVLGGSDVDGDTLAFAIASAPAHGTISGTPPAVTYTPAGNYNGADSFTFTANDGAQTSAPVAITITVTAVNDVPVIAGAALSGNEGEYIAIPLPDTDIDGDTLTYSVVTYPSRGALSAAQRRYNSVDYSGTVSFSLAASDGQSTSAPATFTVNVAPMPDPPLARDDIAIVTPGQPLRVSVLANDLELDGEPMSVDSVTTPLHGTVQIDGDDLVYTTSAANTTPDTFTYTISDNTGLTATATVTLGMGEFPSGLPVRYVDQAVNPGSTWNQFLQQDISRDGRYVVFISSYPVTAGDTNQANDVYLWDRMTGARERISVATGGMLADAASERPSISADGRFVAFASAATNLVAGDSNGTVDVFVRDRVAGTTTRVSVDSMGAQVSGHSRDPDISADGAVVAFLSTAFALVPNDANGAADVFVRDLNAGVTSRVSIGTGGGEADLLSATPVLSGDGKVVAFVSAATNLVAGDMNGKADVFIHDRTSGVTERVSVSSTGGEGNNYSEKPALSYDGRFVAFSSTANNLVPNTTGSAYVRDRQALTTLAIGLSAGHLSLSGDGRYLVGHMASGSAFVRDRFAAQTQYFSTSSAHDIWFPVISANGRYVTVLSDQALDNQLHSAGTKVFVYANPL
jgi:hypothetical protein